MTIRFSTEMGPIAGFAFTCGHDNGTTEHRFGTYRDARAILLAEIDAHGVAGGLAVCGDDYCRVGLMHTVAVEADPAPSFGAGGSNTAHLLKLLGLPSTPDEDGCFFGSMPAQDFLDRVLAAQAASVDYRVPAFAAAGPSIHVGRRPGYAEQRLADLRAIAEFGVSRGRTVQWGG
jgi:hypothetical protein